MKWKRLGELIVKYAPLVVEAVIAAKKAQKQ